MPSSARLLHVSRLFSRIASPQASSSSSPLSLSISRHVSSSFPTQPLRRSHPFSFPPSSPPSASSLSPPFSSHAPPSSSSSSSSTLMTRRLFSSTSTSTSTSATSSTSKAASRSPPSASASTSTSTSSSASQPPPRPPPSSFGRSAQRMEDIRRRNNNLLAWALTIVLATVGLSYASVPLYRVFCQVTGFGGTLKTPSMSKSSSSSSSSSSASKKDKDTPGDEDEDDMYTIDETRIVPGRPLKIRFNADVSAGVPWRFTPEQTQVVVLPGESVLAFYYAENKSPDAITGIATYNVTPAKAAIYFNKVQCFCFDEQRLKPGEGLDMPVFFYIDPDFADDRNMDDVSDIMLSYTFFKAEDVTPEQLQRAQALAAGG